MKLSKFFNIGKNPILGKYLSLGEEPQKSNEKLIIGDSAIIRSHSIIYKGTKIGNNFQTGHGILIRENNIIGNNVRIGTHSIIDKENTIEENVNIRNNVIIYQNVNIGKNVSLMDGAVIGYIPKGTGATKRKINETGSSTNIGNNSAVLCGAVIYNGVHIEKNTMICDFSSIREGCRIGNKCVIARGVTINYDTIIGNNVKIMDNTHITGNMIIEDDVFISTHVSTTNDKNLGRNIGKNKWNGPIIRKGAGIGAGANILPGIEIGEYSIVGAGAVVTKDVPPHTMVMGIPARKIKGISDI